MSSVTFPTSLGGDGSTVTDDSNASTGLGNGGHRTRFVPCLSNMVAVAAFLTALVQNQSDVSSTSLTIGTGSKSLTTSKGYNWAIGQWVNITSTASPANAMYGQVTAYNSTTGALTVSIATIFGTGTFAAWTISATSPSYATLPIATVAEAQAGTEINMRQFSPSLIASAIAALAPQSFAAGTVMLFVQSTAPTGWTKSTAHNDKALRIVSGTAGSGGTVAFSTAFASGSTGAFTLSTAEMPSHTHTIGGTFTNYQSAGSTQAGSGTAGFVNNTVTTSGSSGSGGSHSHSLSLAVQYVDAIIATKN